MYIAAEGDYYFCLVILVKLIQTGRLIDKCGPVIVKNSSWLVAPIFIEGVVGMDTPSLR